uniref:Uncharacterized protein n=1 Tax=Anguilla anguilla TaxID=7936 RepID=A0A0E9VY52_ANGAN
MMHLGHHHIPPYVSAVQGGRIFIYF